MNEFEAAKKAALTGDDNLAALLAEHIVWDYDDERNVWRCKCGDDLDADGSSEAVAAHQAVVIRAVTDWEEAE